MLPIYRADILQNLPQSIDATTALLVSEGYVADRALSTLTFLSLTLNRPIFLEGEAGVGKTELAKVIAKGLGRDLIRLQCYEGLDASSSVYEWNFAGQMLAMRNGAEQGDIYSEKYLIKRALLQAVEPHPSGPPVLLIDEIDRTDAPFEAFLLEALSDFQVTVPELGVIKAPEPPIVILTSNRTREVHDALKRRCLYHWVDYPGFDREMEILRAGIIQIQSMVADSADVSLMGRYLAKQPSDTRATGGTNWPKYLPPKFQLRIAFPFLWTDAEREAWGTSN